MPQSHFLIPVVSRFSPCNSSRLPSVFISTLNLSSHVRAQLFLGAVLPKQIAALPFTEPQTRFMLVQSPAMRGANIDNNQQHLRINP